MESLCAPCYIYYSVILLVLAPTLTQRVQGTFTLNPSSVSACPNQMVTLSCSSTESTFTSHLWTICVPECEELNGIIRVNTLSTITETAIGTNCPPGIVFQLMRVSESPFISNLTTNTALDGTIVTCGNNAATSSAVRITIAVRPDRPDGVMTSEVFNSGNVAVTLQWNNLPEVFYNVSVTPRVSAVVMMDSSAMLTVMYNIRYSVSIVATNCAGESLPYVTELYYVDCGTPTTGSNVIIEGLVPPRVAQGTNVTFKCRSGQSYILTGPAAATCNSSGLWEADTRTVECIANCWQPMASRNVQIMYNSTLEGATVVFKCNKGFTPNVTHAGICQNNSMWYRDPADLVCVNPSGMDCGTPSPPADGSIMSLTGTLEGSRVTFRCDDGFTPSLEMDAECQQSGNWEPNPAEFACATATMSIVYSQSQLSYGGAVSVTGVICSTVFFVLGIVFGMLCLYLILRYKQSHANKNDQHAESQPPLPVYEDIHVIPPSQRNNKQIIDLKENVAYGPIKI